jgi:N-acetylglucosamine-6-phosphate deacetylase
MRTLIKNIDVVTAHGVLENSACVIEGDKILSVGETALAHDKVLDGEGGYLFPGFIDLHCHGADGFDFMDAAPAEMKKISDFHLSHGTTTMVATTLADAPAMVEKSLENFDEHKRLYPKSTLAGLHLEGPWFSPEQCGAQPAEYFRNPSASELEELKKKHPHVLRVSAAPELEGAFEFGRKALELGMVAAAAHTDADFSTIEEAAKNGYTLMTHLYSGMKGVTRKNAYRIAGAVEAGLYFDDIFVEIIADGKHLPIELLKFIYKCKGADKICLVTDAMRACGMPDGSRSKLGSLDHGGDIIVEDGVAKLPDRTAFAGSVATFDRLVRTMASAIGDKPVELAKMASTTPAAVMGFSDRGEIAVGKAADLVIMSRDYKTQLVIHRGEVV